MPMYDFKCPACGHEHEAIVKTGTEKTKCPKCGKTSKRVLVQGKTGISFRFNFFADA